MWLIGFTMLFVANAVSIVFSAIPPYGEKLGISRHEVAQLLSITGAFEIFCRGFHGWFSDRNVMPCLLQLALCGGVTGVAAILCPIINGKVGIGLLTAALGAAGTSTFNLVPIVIRQLLGADHVTTGMGIQLFFQSSSFILSTFMAGKYACTVRRQRSCSASVARASTRTTICAAFCGDISRYVFYAACATISFWV